MFQKLLSFALLSLVLVGGVANRCDASAAGMTSVPKPFFFTENKGQWDTRVLYKCQAKNGMTWFLERDGITLLVSKEDRTKEALVDPMERDLPEMLRRHPARYSMKSHALKFHFVKGEGSKVNGEREVTDSILHPTPSTLHRASAQSVEANGEMPWKNNYFLGNDSTKWAPNCRNFSTVVYREVWDGIDIEWYESDGKLEFDFIVHPGFDPNQIRMSCEGLDKELGIGDREPGTELRLQTSLGELRTALPSVYQVSANGSRTEIEAAFELIDQNTFGIKLPNGYNPDHSLRIDPLVYSTFLGGSSGPTSGGNESAVAIINDGNNGVLIAGVTTSNNFPMTTGTLDSIYNGNNDCFVTHLNDTGSQLLFSTYLGGSLNDNAYAITSDNNGGNIITGDTKSVDFPVTDNAFDTSYNGGGNVAGDCFLTRLNSTGSQLIYSTYVGSSSDDCGNAIVNDGNGGCFVTGFTRGSNFPVTNGSFDTSFNGGLNDCFVTYLNSTGSELIYCTYLGGSGEENGKGIIKNDSNDVIVTGATTSTNFPITPGVFDSLTRGVFVSSFISDGSRLVYSTFIGSGSCTCITNDGNGGTILSGYTSQTNFPTTIGAYDTSYNGGSFDCFITRLNSTGTQLIYSTFIGGSSSERIYSIDSMNNGGAVVTGYTTSANYPTTPNAFNPAFQGGGIENSDAFITYLNNTGSSLLYSTFLGGTDDDFGNGITNVGDDEILVAGSTASLNFPVTPGAFDTSYNGGSPSLYSDCFVTRLSLDSTDVATEFSSLPLCFKLHQNYPNPFNSTTVIEYTIPRYGLVKLELFDLLGRNVSMLVNSIQNTGTHRIQLDGKNLSSGEYFYRLSTRDVVATRKLLLLR